MAKVNHYAIYELPQSIAEAKRATPTTRARPKVPWPTAALWSKFASALVLFVVVLDLSQLAGSVYGSVMTVKSPFINLLRASF